MPAIHRLKLYLPGYEKGAGHVFAATRERLATATQRARALAGQFDAYSDPEPYTAIVDLVTRLTTLRG